MVEYKRANCMMLMRVSMDIDSAIKTCDFLSQKLFTHAFPTIFNAANPRSQRNNLFLLTMGNARYVDQGHNKRPGAFVTYLVHWHADIFNFLDLRKNHGNEEQCVRDLFHARWTPDQFMMG